MISSYHWDNREKAAKDFKYICKLRRRLIFTLKNELNHIHKTEFSVRAWHLMLGYWLQQFIAVTFDRWSMLKDNKIHLANKKTKYFKRIVLPKIPQNSEESSFFFFHDKWNNEFTALLNYLMLHKRHSLLSMRTNSNYMKKKPCLKKIKKNKIHLFIHALLKSIFKVLIFYIPQSKAVFVFSKAALTPLAIIKIRFHLPGYLIVDPEFPKTTRQVVKPSMRKWSLASSMTDDQFIILIKKLIPWFLPTCFLEEFKTLQTKIKSINPTLQPSVILTANSHFSNDPFKMWAAKHLDRGTQLVCGQHGGGPFHRYNGAHQFELDIADLAVTTGNGNRGYPHLRDVGQFFSTLKTGVWNQNGKLLLVLGLMPKYVFDLRSMPLGNQMTKYFDDTFKFYKNLDENIQKNTLVRMYGNKLDYGWNIHQQWRMRFPKVKLVEEVKPISDFAPKIRLFISTYNATCYNEFLAANIPTVIFWDTRLWEWAKFANADFAKLQNVKIFHDSPESASQHVSRIWGSVAGWWHSQAVQKARIEFCRKYANRDTKIENRLAGVLNEALEKNNRTISLKK